MVTADSRVVATVQGESLDDAWVAPMAAGQRQADHIARQFERSDVESGRQDCVF